MTRYPQRDGGHVPAGRDRLALRTYDGIHLSHEHRRDLRLRGHPCDAEGGEVLLLPTRAEVVEDDAAFFDLISDLVDLRWEEGLDYSELRDIASERI